MEKIDFTVLYALQDRVLEAIFSEPSGFYLTGGTCLHRFYHEERYSVDLDLFNKDNGMFREDSRFIIENLNKNRFHHELIVDSRDFIRILVEDGLRVDMVNDRVYRIGKTVRLDSGIVLDNVLNICANKICAVLGRDDPKDVFDLYTIHRYEAPEWFSVLEEANKKCVVDPEMLKFRLNSFPLELVDLIHVRDTSMIQRLKQDYPGMIEAILESC